MTKEKQVWVSRRAMQAACEKAQSADATMADVKAWVATKMAWESVRDRVVVEDQWA